ncbi:MAG TPA: site-2 protease family protein [Terracidiphilus sp.]|nr:site-2 protease family protein [Terracidiphilus sp.]
MMPDAYQLLRAIMWINVTLLVFNMLAIYPLDGGQILRSLLWFALGRARSLMVATVLGVVGVVEFLILALWLRSFWLGAISAFMLMNCRSGLRHAQGLLRRARLPHREGFACPSCRTAPAIGAYWKCGQRGQPFDTFQSRSVRPHFAAQFATTVCLDCGEQCPLQDWIVGAYAGLGAASGG